MSRFKFARQFDQMDCDPACIRMVAAYHGKDYPLSYLRSLSHLTREGVSVAGIRDALRQLSADSASFEMTLEQLECLCPLPAILHWEQNHFVVLYKIKKSRFTGKISTHLPRFISHEHRGKLGSLYLTTRINIKNTCRLSCETVAFVYDVLRHEEYHRLSTTSW